MWLYEGLVKAADGWFSSPKLASFLGMASDATSAASPTAAYVTKIDDVFRIKTGLINFFIETETRIAGGEDIIAQHFARLEFFHFGDFNLVPWFLNNVVLANDGVAMFFQILVVVLEILVGLMLLGGALTFIGSLISLGLVIMFMSSTGLYEKAGGCCLHLLQQWVELVALLVWITIFFPILTMFGKTSGRIENLNSFSKVVLTGLINKSMPQ